jgi:ketosteroid isomerase-like protein
MIRLLPALVLFFVAAIFPAKARADDVFDMTKARKEIEEANRAYREVLRKGDAAGIANFFTEDGKSMGPNEPAAVGREKIQALYARFIADGATVLELDIKGIWGTEALMAEEGLFKFSNKDGKELDRGKYIVLWKKIGAEWKLFRDIYNSDLPIAPQK